MSPVTNIILKDARRLRLPLANWVALMGAKLVYYASIAGIWRPADFDALRGLDNGPLPLFLRFVLEPLIAFFLVAWHSFQDPVVEKDPFWITRPISGRQLLAAKVGGVFLLFVLPPTLINVPWWLACGFGAAEIGFAALMTTLLFGSVAAVAMAIASLTDGFPRFIFWTLMLGIALPILYFLLLMVKSDFGPVTFGSLMGGDTTLNATRIALWLGGLFLTAAAVVCHQFLTRRQGRSAAIGAAGALLAGILGVYWTADLVPVASRPDLPADEGVQVNLTGPVRVPNRTDGERVNVSLSVKLENVPDDVAALHLATKGNWSLNGTNVMDLSAFRGRFSYFGDVMERRLVGLPARPGERAMEWNVSLQGAVPRAIAERFTRESGAMRGEFELTLLRPTIVAELPLRPQTMRVDGRSYTMGVPTVATRSDVAGQATRLSFPFVIRVGGLALLDEGLRAGGESTATVLVRRTTGEIATEGPGMPGTHFLTLMNGVIINFSHPGYDAPAIEDWIRDASFAIVHIRAHSVARRPFDLDSGALFRGARVPQIR